MIRGMSNRASVVADARGHRHNRQKEIDADEAKLDLLRRQLGLSADADLGSKVPGPEAVELVQSLASEAIARKPKLDAAQERVTELVEKKRQTEERIREATAKGYGEPLGIVAAQFADLTVKKASLDVRERNRQAAVEQIRRDLDHLGPADVEELERLRVRRPSGSR